MALLTVRSAMSGQILVELTEEEFHALAEEETW